VGAQHEVPELERWAGAVAAADRQGLVAAHAEDVVLFDVPPLVQVRSLDAYLRLTVGLRREGDQWLAAHEHHSVPTARGRPGTRPCTRRERGCLCPSRRGAMISSASARSSADRAGAF
jgi:ketosteroid isomerase-like protein